VKKILIGLVSFILFLVLLAFVIPFFVNLDSYKDKIILPVESALHRKVNLGHIKLTLLPGVGIGLENLRISNTAGFSSDPFVSLSSLEVRVKILPLLWGKKEIRKIVLKRPEILVERNKEGKFNFSDLISPKPPEKEKEAKKEAPLAAARGFVLSSLVISDGRIVLRDTQVKSTLSIEEVNLKISNVSLETAIKLSLSAKILPGEGKLAFSGKIGPVGEDLNFSQIPLDISLTTVGLNPNPIFVFFKKSAGPAFTLYTDIRAAGSMKEELTSEGSLEIRDISLPSDDGKWLEIPPVTLKEKISVRQATNTIKIDTLTVSQNVLSLTLQGEISQYSKEPRLNLALSSNEFSPIDLVKAYPSIFEKLPSNISLSGPGAISMTLIGPNDNLEIKGDVKLDKIDVAYGDYFHKSPGVPLSLNIYAIKERNSLKVNKLGLAIKNFVLDVSGRVENLSDPAVDLKASSGLLRPGEWVDIIPLLKQYSIGGGLRMDIVAKGNPSSPSISGKLIIEDISAQIPGLAPGVKGLFSSIAFTPKSLNIENLSAQSGSSSIRIKGRVENFTTPDVSFDLYSSKMNIDELFPPSEKKPAEKEEKPAEKPNESLRKSRVSGTIKIDSGIVKKAQFRNFHAAVQLKNGKFNMSDLTMDIYGGNVSGSLSAGLLEKEPPVDISLNAKNVEIGPLLKETTSWKDSLTGSLSSVFSLSGKGMDSSTLSKTLKGQGKFSLSQGKIKSLPLMEKLIGQAGINELKGVKSPETAFNDINGSASLSDGKVNTSDLKLSSKDLDAQLTGSFSLDSSLDFKGVATLSKSHTSRLGSGTLQNLVKDEQGRIQLPFRLSGTILSPKVDLDKDAMTDMAKAQARKKVEEEVTKKINKELTKPETKKKLEDLQKEGGKKLKGLFK